MYILCVFLVVNGIGNYIFNLFHTAKTEALDDILVGIERFAERSEKMKIKIDCKHAKSYDDKSIKCTRDNSIRNVVKKRCAYDCPHYKKKRWF